MIIMSWYINLVISKYVDKFSIDKVRRLAGYARVDEFLPHATCVLITDMNCCKFWKVYFDKHESEIMEIFFFRFKPSTCNLARQSDQPSKQLTRWKNFKNRLALPLTNRLNLIYLLGYIGIR